MPESAKKQKTKYKTKSMGDEIFLEPLSITIGTFFLLNLIYCVVTSRRIRRLEQQVHTLHGQQIRSSDAPEQPQQSQTVYPPATYIQPTAPTYANPALTYSYYQPQPQVPASTYYPQDPQGVYR